MIFKQDNLTLLLVVQDFFLRWTAFGAFVLLMVNLPGANAIRGGSFLSRRLDDARNTPIPSTPGICSHLVTMHGYKCEEFEVRFRFLFHLIIDLTIFWPHTYIAVVCVCVCIERPRERERGRNFVILNDPT